MKVILKESMGKLGMVGDTVNVKDGYARNFLLPRGLAVPANTPNLQALDRELKVKREKLQRHYADAANLATRLEQTHCTFVRKTGESDRLFGSVTSMDVAELLTTQGFSIDRRRIDLEEPIKTLGETVVPIKLHPEVTAKLRVVVTREEEAE
ncbi:MAG: 50S ribosomal protein L9 [Candidatus Tectomicrobia bacterium]|nr:50S ribosomal protein L9 [Candidatus Tectomicrobia bacterium]